MQTKEVYIDPTKNGAHHHVNSPIGEYEVWLHPAGRQKDKRGGIRHRLNGPAYESDGGNRAWFFCGELHRLDGPAVEWADGHKEWYVDGKRHRLDGPAVEWPSGEKRWCINDKRYTTFQSYLEAVKPLITEQEYFILVLTYGTEK